MQGEPVVGYGAHNPGVAGSNPVPAIKYGPIALMGERLLCKQDVAGSSPAGSTAPSLGNQ